MQTKNINNQPVPDSTETRNQERRIVTPFILCRNSNGTLISSHAEVEGCREKLPSSAGGPPKTIPPPYRMPPQPLYSEPASIPGSATPSQQILTHSSKFPIEREVILSSLDKNSKIPILNDYHKKQGKAAAVAPDAPTIQVAWTEERGTNRSYCEARNFGGHETIQMDSHQVYKAQPLTLLETTNGTEPSPIVNEEDSNGFYSNSHPKNAAGRSHSTPEMDSAKPFPSRTYHTIKDMISNRFNKSKTDSNGTGLNNSDIQNQNATVTNNNNDIKDQLSPHSQLVQRGVYLANSQQANRNPNYSHVANGLERRNQERDHQLMSSYRERGVDVCQTIGVSKQSQQGDVRPQTDLQRASSKQSILDNETPIRHRSQLGSQPEDNAGNGPKSRMDEVREPSSAGPPIMCRRPEPKRYEHVPHVVTPRPQPPRPGPSRHDVQAIAGDLRYACMARAKSNDHLLEAKPQIKHKSKSFENLGECEEEIVDRMGIKSSGPLSGLSSDYEKNKFGGHSDSGRGSTVYSSGKLKHTTDTSPESSESHRVNKENQWADMVETELKHILEPKSNASIANSTLSESSASPPLPPASPDLSSDEFSAAYGKHKSILYGNKLETPYRNSVPSSHRQFWNSRSTIKDKSHHRLAVTTKRPENPSKIPSTVASSSIDLDSMLDEENNTSDEDVSTTDTRAIRKQLEGLESMYSEVLKLLGVRKSNVTGRYQPSDPRVNKRRVYGSASSLPSSVSSRPIRDRHRRPDDRKKFVRDIKGINKRFQRLESHVVTLARSVAHLSSEMRTQHLMIQEMEVIRGELTSLRTQTNMLTVRSQSLPRFHHLPTPEQTNSSPDKMKRLTKFFGDEPPLLRLFLKKLGYEKYAAAFEKERIGLVELPYMSEERLQKLGIPMGPRLRILQEAQLGFPGTNENTLCIV